MSEPIDINRNKSHFNILAICLGEIYDDVTFDKKRCKNKWIATVIANTSLFSLECPQCGAQDSFASFIPRDYLDQFP